MIANIEITAYKAGERRIFYVTKELYSGIAVDLFERCRSLGYEKISIRII